MALSLPFAVLANDSGSPPPTTLASAVNSALENDPSIKAARQALIAAEANASQRSLPSNPELELEAENIAGDAPFEGTDSAEYTFMLSQPIRLGGKRSAEKAAADQESELAQADLELARTEVILNTSTAFYGLLAANEKVRIAEKSIIVARAGLEDAQRKMQAGAASSLESIRAEILLRRTQSAQNEALIHQSIFRRLFDALTGIPDGAQRIDGDLFELHSLPALEDLLVDLEASTRWQRWDAEVDRAEALREREDARRLPDVDAGAGVRLDEAEGAHSFLFSLSLPLPLRDRNQGGRAAASAESKRVTAEALLARRQLQQEIVAIHGELSSAHLRAKTLANHLLPAAEKLLKESQEGYSLGRFGSIELIDAQRTLSELRHEYISAFLSLHKSHHQLEALIHRH